jgi:hypothetical protein
MRFQSKTNKRYPLYVERSRSFEGGVYISGIGHFDMATAERIAKEILRLAKPKKQAPR